MGKNSIAHKGLLYAGKVIAATAIDFLENPEMVEEAKKEHGVRLDHKPYVCPIPKDVVPAALGMKK